jgi:diacylglycerol O-acyltransferase / wax synthase
MRSSTAVRTLIVEEILVRLLNGTDAAGLYQESRELPFHTLKLVVLRDDWTAEALRERVRERQAALDPLRWHLVRPAIPIAHPWWRLGPLPDLNQHVHELSLASGSTLRELCAEAARLGEPMLDRDQPLWRMWVFRGLPDGKAAVLIKLHHSLADGLASRELIERIFGAESSSFPPGADDPQAHGWQQLPLIVRSLRRTLGELPTVFKGTRRALREQNELTKSGVPRARAAFTGATPPWGMQITPSRDLAVVELPIARVRRIRARHGVSTSDLTTALLGGALRPLLPIGTELTAVAPISTRGDTDDPWGNHGSFFFRTLATDRGEPADRLAVVAAESRVARERRNSDGPRALEGWWELYPLYRALRVLAEGAMRVRGRITAAAIVSNVTGPPLLESQGVRVEQLFSVGPLATGMLLNLTAWSYGDVIAFGVLTCPQGGLDAWAIADAIDAELAALDS